MNGRYTRDHRDFVYTTDTVVSDTTKVTTPPKQNSNKRRAWTKKDKTSCLAKATSGNQITSGTATVAEVILVPWCWLLLKKKEVKARVVQTRIDVSRNEIWNLFFGVRATEGTTKRNTYTVAWQRKKNIYIFANQILTTCKIKKLGSSFQCFLVITGCSLLLLLFKCNILPN